MYLSIVLFFSWFEIGTLRKAFWQYDSSMNVIVIGCQLLFFLLITT